MASLCSIAEFQVAAVTLGARPQPSVGQAPAVSTWSDGTIGKSVRLSFLDGVGPVQSRIARHLDQGTWLEVDVDSVAGAAELHEDGSAEGQSIELIIGRVGVDVRWDAGARGVVLQAHLLGGPSLVGWDQGLQPVGKGLEGDVWVNTKGFVVKSVAIVQRYAAWAMRPLELGLEYDQKLLLEFLRDELIVPEDAMRLDG